MDHLDEFVFLFFENIVLDFEVHPDILITDGNVILGWISIRSVTDSPAAPLKPNLNFGCKFRCLDSGETLLVNDF